MPISVYFVEAKQKWRCDVRVGHARDKNYTRKTKMCHTKHEAQQWGRKKEAELLVDVERMARNRMLLGSRMHFRQAVEMYKLEYAPQLKRPNKAKKAIDTMTRKVHFADNFLTDITKADIAQVKQSMINDGLANNTVNRNLSVLSGMFEYCREQGWLDDNVVRQVKRMPKGKGRVRRVSNKERELILAEAEYDGNSVPKNKFQEVCLVWLIALETGMRSGEILSVQSNDIHIKKRYVHLDDSKNSDPRDVVLTPYGVSLWALAIQMQHGKNDVFSLTDGTRDNYWRQLRDAAGLKDADLCFHDSRHEAASQKAKKYKQLTLCKQFGWRDPKNAMIYYNPTREDFLEELDAGVDTESGVDLDGMSKQQLIKLLGDVSKQLAS